MEFYEDDKELENQQEVDPSTLNKTFNRTLNKTLKTKATKVNPRGRPRKTRVLVKRKTVKRPQATKIAKQTKTNTNHIEASQIKDNNLISVITPDLLVKRRPGRPKGSKGKIAATEIELRPRLTRAAAKLVKANEK